MKKIILSIATICAIAILTILNIHITETHDRANELTISQIGIKTALAAEYAGWSNFWAGYGFYKDEREIVRDCPIEESYYEEVCIEWDKYRLCTKTERKVVNPPLRTEIVCGTGNVNCKSVRC